MKLSPERLKDAWSDLNAWRDKYQDVLNQEPITRQSVKAASDALGRRYEQVIEHKDIDGQQAPSPIRLTQSGQTSPPRRFDLHLDFYEATT